MTGRRKIVYRTTFPNGKIYVGQDVTDDILYFGSPSRSSLEADFPFEQRDSFTLTRDVLWVSTTATMQEVCEVERHFISELQANDPARGYNKRPIFRLKSG